MKEETGASYQSAKHAKLLVVADAKVGKSSSIIAGCLGVLPWQIEGGVVDRPENLHVLAVDSSALGNLNTFLTKTCGASEEALKYRVYNMQDDYRKAFQSDTPYDAFFYNTLMATISKVQERASRGGVHVLLLSSLTTIGRAILRGISGPVSSEGGIFKKSVMDKSKWPMYNMQLNELQAHGQSDLYHCIWEGHLGKKLDFINKDEKGQPEEKDSIQLQGSVGASWAANVEQVVTMQRRFGSTHPGTKCDITSYNTKPNLNMVASGRGFTELLDKDEKCITAMFRKLGLRVGNYGKKG